MRLYYYHHHSHSPSVHCYGLVSIAFVVSYWLLDHFQHPMRREHMPYQQVRQSPGCSPHLDCWPWPWPTDMISFHYTAPTACHCLLADVWYRRASDCVFQLPCQWYEVLECCYCWTSCHLLPSAQPHRNFQCNTKTNTVYKSNYLLSSLAPKNCTSKGKGKGRVLAIALLTWVRLMTRSTSQS